MQTRRKTSILAIKLDHEVRLRRRRYPEMRNFEADLFMMVSRPSEANLGRRMPKYYRGKFSGRKLFLTVSRPDSRGSRELNRRPWGPGEGQGGPNKGHLASKIGQKNTNK